MHKLHKPSIGGMVTAIKLEKWASCLLNMFMLWCNSSLVFLIARDTEQSTNTACFFHANPLHILGPTICMDCFARLKCSALVTLLRGLSLAKGSIIIPRSKPQLQTVYFLWRIPHFLKQKNLRLLYSSASLTKWFFKKSVNSVVEHSISKYHNPSTTAGYCIKKILMMLSQLQIDSLNSWHLMVFKFCIQMCNSRKVVKKKKIICISLFNFFHLWRM